MNNLKALRKENKIKVNVLTELLGISSVYYYDLEKGIGRLNEDILLKLSDFYKVTTDYLLGITEGKNNVVLTGDSLPEELRGYVDAISTAKKDFTPEELKSIIEAAKMIKAFNKSKIK